MLAYNNNTYHKINTEGSSLEGYADIVKALPGLFHSIFNNVSDTWSAWNKTTKTQYVTQMLKLSTAIVIAGKARSVANVFRSYISKVAVHEGWSRWKTKNPGFALMVNQASNEVNQFRTSGYNKYMQFIDPQSIKNESNTSGNKSNTTYLILGIGAIAISIMVFKKNKREELNR